MLVKIRQLKGILYEDLHVFLHAKVTGQVISRQPWLPCSRSNSGACIRFMTSEIRGSHGGEEVGSWSNVSMVNKERLGFSYITIWQMNPLV
jgi:hypothetical protein